VVYDYVEKADLSKGYQNTKRKLGQTARFSVKEKAMHSLYFNTFLELCLPNYL